MLFFTFSPLLIRQNIAIEKGKTRRTLRCATHINTHPESWRPNVLSDGTKIDSLPCVISIHCIDEEGFPLDKGEEFLLFHVPECANEAHYAPASLALQVYLSALAFNELWQMVHENRRIIFHGEIARADLTETSHDPIRGGSTYEWNINEPMKIVESFSFRLAKPSEVHDSAPTELKNKINEKYTEFSQIRRICLNVACQIEDESERRGVEMKRDEFEGSPDVMNNIESFYQRSFFQKRKNEKQELWFHKDIDNSHDDYFAGDKATDLLICLLECPWIRCDELEWATVDYLVFWEIYNTFGEQLNATAHTPRWHFIWPFKKIRAAQAQALHQRQELFIRMTQAYNHMRPSGVFSPYQIRDALLHAQRAGAVWEPTILAILDRAMNRDPPIWLVPK